MTVRYRVEKPTVFEPPKNHTSITDEYEADSLRGLELAEQKGMIEILDYGGESK